MNNLKKLLVLIFICIIFLFPKKADAGTASKVVDKGMIFTAKATYYITKYTLKAGCFIIKTTTKGVIIISKSIFNGTKDAFKSTPKAKPVNKKPDTTYTLPPNPKLYTLPPVPKLK